MTFARASRPAFLAGQPVQFGFAPECGPLDNLTIGIYTTGMSENRREFSIYSYISSALFVRMTSSLCSAFHLPFSGRNNDRLDVVLDVPLLSTVHPCHVWKYSEKLNYREYP